MTVPYIFSYPSTNAPPRTARDVITDAFHRMALISEDEGLTASQLARALPVMNDMMFGFTAEGIQYDHTNLQIDDLVNMPDQLVRSVMWMLLSDLADEYGKVLTATQQLNVDRARGALQAFYFAVPVAQLDDGIRSRQRFGYYGNIKNI